MRKKIKISYHSFISVITNSSTEIFVAATDSTISFIKDMINMCLDIAEREDIRADDLFNFGIELEDDSSIGDQRIVYVKGVLKGNTSLKEEDKDPIIKEYLMSNQDYSNEDILNKTANSIYDYYEKCSIVDKPSWWNDFEGWAEEDYGMITPSNVIIELKQDVEKDERLTKLVDHINIKLMSIFSINAERLG